MKRLATSSLATLSVLLMGLSASAFEVPELTVGELTSLENGDAIINVWKDTEHKKKPTVSIGGIDILTSAANVFEIMQDCSRMSEISSDIRLCEVLETAPDGSWDIRKQKFAVSPLLPKFNTTFRTHYSDGPDGGHVMQIEKISGDLSVQIGRWDIIPLGTNQTRVIYQASIKPKIPVPGKLIREQTTKGIPDILRNLRDIAEADQAETIQNVSLPMLDDM